MNRGEAAGIGTIAGIASIGFYYFVMYFFVFENFLVVMKQTGTDLYPVEAQLWWLFVGFGFILMSRAASKGFKWARRDYCEHCNKELKK